MSVLASNLILLTVIGLTPADSETVDKQKATANANWKQIFGDEEPAVEETAHLIIIGVAAMSPAKLRELSAGYEARYNLARKALKIDSKDELWPGKLTVYLIPTRPQFSSFMRTIAKKRPGPDDSAVVSIGGDGPFVAAGPPQTKHDPTIEAQAGEQIAAAVLAKRGGDTVPAWLLAGFGRATSWRATPASPSSQRMQVKRVILGKTAADVWDGKLNAEEAGILRASLAEFLAYGPAASSFPQFVDAFKPSDNRQPKTAADALKAASYTPDRLTREWHLWVARGK